jgi:outer membrane protein TolC
MRPFPSSEPRAALRSWRWWAPALAVLAAATPAEAQVGPAATPALSGSAPGGAAKTAPGVSGAEAGRGGGVQAMTLPEAIAFARAHQPALEVARARIHAAEADAEVPRAQWRPAVAATAQVMVGSANNTTATYVGTSLPDIARVGATRSTAAGGFTRGLWTPYGSTLAAVGANQLLFEFGRVAAQSAAADAAVEIEKSQAAVSAVDLDLSVKESYYAVLAARAVLKASEAAYDRAKTHRDFAKVGVDQGLRAPIDLTRAEADLVRFDVGRLRARAGLTSAQGVLAAAIASPALLVDAGADAPQPADTPSLDAGLQQAAARDPAVREALARVRLRELQTEAIGAELRPALTLTGTLSGRAGGAPPSSGDTSTTNGWLPNVPNWDVGLLFTWPLYDGVVDARQRASRRWEDAERAGVGLVRQQLVAGVQQAYVAFGAARDVVPGLERAVDAARANMAQADARFRMGIGTSVELADASALLADAEIQLAVGRFEVARARAALGRVISEGL